MSTRKDQLLRRAAGKKGRNVALTREEKALRDALEKMGGGDWNASEGEPGYVKNRTHYEETTVVNEPLNITWDGNTDGLVSVAGEPFYKVSDAVLTDAQIKSATVSFGGASVSLASTWDDAPEGGISDEIVMTVDFVVFVRKDGAVIHNSLAFPECGVYFLWDGPNFYTSSLTTTEPVEHTKTVVKKLDKKFLPDSAMADEVYFYVISGAADHPYIYTDSSTEVNAMREDIIDAIGTGAKIALINLADNSKCYPFIRADMEKGCIVFEFFGVNASGVGNYREKYTGEYDVGPM